MNFVNSAGSLSSDEILKIRQERMFPSVHHYYRKPLHIRKASMQWVWDTEEKKYLDAIGGIVTISAGHNHPRIKDRLRAWMEEDRPQHTTVLYLSEPMAEFALKLTGITPSNLRRCLFTNSGSEANEMAILLARQYSGCHEIIALNHAYHGGTSGTISLLGHYSWKWGGAGLSGIVHAAQPNCYRCPWGATPQSCALECAQDVEETILSSTSGKIAGMIVEPIQGVGGFIVPPKEYFPRIYSIVKKYGGIYISDEVQTGMGRTGKYWFGILHNEILPDMITMAKGLGNGAPIGAVVTRDEIAESMQRKMHFNTFGGNPWSTLQASETLSILEEENVLKRSEELGDILLAALQAIQKDSKILGDVRGRGLLVGLEIVKDKKTKTYGVEEAAELMEETRERGLLVGKGGRFGNVIRLTPPLCIGEVDVQEMIRILREAIFATEKKMGYLQ